MTWVAVAAISHLLVPQMYADDGLPVHSFQSLLADFATSCRIQATTAFNDKCSYR